MDKESLFKEAFESVIDSDEEKAMGIIIKAENMGIDLVELLTEGFSAGIKHLGDLFGRGEIFLPELIFAAEILKMVTSEIESKLGAGAISKKGLMVIGTVEGDVHDIGKSIVASLLKTSGIEVIDLGREVPAQVFVDKAKEYNADIVGSSALLTTTMSRQNEIEELLKKEGIRDKVITMIGGAPVTQSWADQIGADYYCEDAVESVRCALEYLDSKNKKERNV